MKSIHTKVHNSKINYRNNDKEVNKINFLSNEDYNETPKKSQTAPPLIAKTE